MVYYLNYHHPTTATNSVPAELHPIAGAVFATSASDFAPNECLAE